MIVIIIIVTAVKRREADFSRSARDSWALLCGDAWWFVANVRGTAPENRDTGQIGGECCVQYVFPGRAQKPPVRFSPFSRDVFFALVPPPPRCGAHYSTEPRPFLPGQELFAFLERALKVEREKKK